MNRAVLLESQHIHPVRGVAEMKKNKKESKREEVLRLMSGDLNIVKTMKSGDCTIHFADNSYRDKTKEEIESAIEHHWHVAWQVVMRMRERGIDV